MDDNQDATLRKRLSVDEDKPTEGSSDSTPSSSSHQKPAPTDKAYEGIRGHERHILFHFFTLFSISFFVGVVFIHLSLWMNSQLINTSSQLGQDIGKNNDFREEDFNSEHEHDKSNLAWNALQTTFEYTGNYFHEKSVNISKLVLRTW